MRKIPILISFILIIPVIVCIIIFQNFNVKANSGNVSPLPKPIIAEMQVEEPKYTSIAFVGDIMLDRAVRSSVVKNFGGDYSKLFENLAELKNADILFGNLEGDVSDTGNNVGSKYSFRMDPVVLPALKDAGFDIVSFANNHVGDWNMKAFKDTLVRLSENNIFKTGAGFTKAEAETPTIIEKNGIKFGFIGFSDVGPDWLKATDTTAGILLASDPRLPDIVKNAKSECDVLIVSFHWGVEYKKIHNTRQETLAHTAIDSGADLVIGHHPHVMEDIEIYNDKPIVYSLGNFIFDQYFSKDTMQGMLFEATFSGKDLIKTNKRIITLDKMYRPEGIFDVTDKKFNRCPKPTKEYKDATYLDVGQETHIPDKYYIPSDLVELDRDTVKYPEVTICLKEEASTAIQKLITDANKAGLKIVVSSGFRSYTDQLNIFKKEVANSENKQSSISVAKPGYSEHQLGVAVDLTSASISYESASGKFSNTEESKWLEDHASEYGFVQSYPKGKESRTGYMYESWHYRYVGIENAKVILKSGQTVNEFLKERKAIEQKKNPQQ